jgi:hypothetical protein
LKIKREKKGNLMAIRESGNTMRECYLDVIFRSHQIKGIITFYKLGVLIRKV